ncbi:MAG: hypothetical protein ILA15_01850 [Clostridiales bacterium]|nr:hypothetical protein [Clostridiales bacterium]
MSNRDRDGGDSTFADKDPTEETTEQTTASETQPSSTTLRHLISSGDKA